MNSKYAIVDLLGTLPQTLQPKQTGNDRLPGPVNMPAFTALRVQTCCDPWAQAKDL